MFIYIKITSNKPEALPYPFIAIGNLDQSASDIFNDSYNYFEVSDNSGTLKISMNMELSLYRIVNATFNGTNATYVESSSGTYNKILTITLPGTYLADSENTIELGIDRIASEVSYVTEHGTTPSPTLVDDVPGNLTNLNLPTLTDTGYVFVGWFYDLNYENQAQVGDRVDSNIILYAKWDKYKLVYNTNGGSYIPDYYGTNVPTLPTPTKERHGFLGWYKDSLFTTSVSVGDAINLLPTFNASTLTATIYAKFYTFTITYDSNGGSAIPSEIGVRLPITLPIPVKMGYVFVGWFYSFAPETQALPNDIIISNVTLVAKWTHIETFDINLYQNSSEKERVNKTSFLTTIGTISGSLRSASSMLNPRIIIERTMIDFNYVYIPLFNRYYYVAEVISVATDMWELALSVDVLMSYKTEILTNSGYIERQQTDYNVELVDSEVISDNGSNFEYENLGRSSVFGSDKLDKDTPSFVLEVMK